MILNEATAVLLFLIGEASGMTVTRLLPRQSAVNCC